MGLIRLVYLLIMISEHPVVEKSFQKREPKNFHVFGLRCRIGRR
jgi:hypothetical protein